MMHTKSTYYQARHPSCRRQQSRVGGLGDPLRDVERLLQHEIRRTDRSLKTVVNDALRLGLGMQGKPPRWSRYKVNPHPFAFKPGIDVDRLNQAR